MKSLILVSVLVLVATSPLPAQVRKAPYLIYNGTPSEMEVHWQLTSTGPCTFEWGGDTTYALGSEITQEYGSDHQHLYVVPDLLPGVRYYYHVTAGPEAFTGTFRAASADNATNLKFMAYGDTRTNPAAHDSVANQMVATFESDSAYHSLVISVGDLVSTGDVESAWDNEFFIPAYPHIQALLRSAPYQSCMGNHEGAGILFAKYFPYPFEASRYWSFDYGPAHFAIVDQYIDYGPGSAELDWLSSDLAASTKLWKFLVLHEPGWSAGGGHGNEVPVQNYLQPLCEQYGVSIVFGGHNHYYARAVVNNVQHITTGGGGAPLATPNPAYPFVVSTSRSYHFCKIEIDSTGLHFAAITNMGAVVDTFSLAARFPPPANFTLEYISETNELFFRWIPNGAAVYNIYSSAIPGGPFDTLVGTTELNSLTVPMPSELRLHYMVVASP